MKKGDNNSVNILKAMTEEILDCKDIVCWWFSIKTKLRSCNNNQFVNTNNNSNLNSNSKQAYLHNSISASMQASSILCDEIVYLWRLIVLNPKLTKQDKDNLFGLIHSWHIKISNIVFERYTDDDSIRNDIDKHPGNFKVF